MLGRSGRKWGDGGGGSVMVVEQLGWGGSVVVVEQLGWGVVA